MAEKDKGTEDFEIVDALKEGTDGGPVEITESGLTLNLGMGGVAKRSAFIIGSDGVITYAESNDDPKKLPDFQAITSALANAS